MAPKSDFGNKRKLPSRSKDSDSSSKKPKFEKRPPPPPPVDEEDSISDDNDNSNYSDHDDEGGAPLDGNKTQKNGNGPARSSDRDGQAGKVFEKGEIALTGDFLLTYSDANAIKAQTRENPT
jgi:pumilio family protein 6